MKPHCLLAAVLSALIVGPGCVSEGAQESEAPGENAEERARVQIGYDISPVPLDLKRKDRVLVGLGSYIINAQSACNDCHTYPPYEPGGNPLQGEPERINADQYMAGGREFETVVTPNITPDESGRPAGLTYEEFETLMRTGRAPHEHEHGEDHEDHHEHDGEELLQGMPWPVYGKMTDRDLRAMYEYLSAIPSRPDNPAPGP